MKLLFFKAPWCTACHAIENNVPSYTVHVDCDEEKDMPIRYNIVGLPQFVAVKEDGTEVARIQTTNVKMLDLWFKEICNEFQE